VSQLGLFDPDDATIVPSGPMIFCTPVCDWCSRPGPDIPADVFSFGRRYKAGDPWWPMVAIGLVAIEEHKRTDCEKRHEHSEALARLLADRDAFGDIDEDEGIVPGDGETATP
jgi:hypothetical protein